MTVFDKKWLKKLYKSDINSKGEQNGQITIIGGSSLFHGAPILSLKTASRVVDMVFFASPEAAVGKTAEKIKSKLSSFIWVPWKDVDGYIKKSDAVLIGPGFMRFSSETKKPNSQAEIEKDAQAVKTRQITKTLLEKYPDKRWVIDAGSLQTMKADWIPKNAILTPNVREYQMLFEEDIIDFQQGTDKLSKIVQEKASRCHCIIVLKGPEAIVASAEDLTVIKGGNQGMTKGGVGDVLAGLTAALYAKNEAFISACSASYIQKKASDYLFDKVGVNYNADDLAENIFPVMKSLLR